jgi:hypothetical protein
MSEFLFTKRRVDHYYWTIEADTLEEACAKWSKLREEGGDGSADQCDIQEDDLMQVVKDEGPNETVYSQDEISEAMH